MKCPECGHDAIAGAENCSRCPHIFLDASADSTRNIPQIFYLVIMAIAMGIVIFGAMMFQTGQARFDAGRKAAEKKAYDHEKLMRGSAGLVQTFDKAGRALTRTTKRISGDEPVRNVPKPEPAE